MALPRVYEYRADDGTSYWSFKLSPSQITPPTRLKLKSRLGVHLVNFISWLRKEGRITSEGIVKK